MTVKVEDRYCFAWLEESTGGQGRERAALWREAMWPPRGVITVSFLDGDPGLRDRVKSAALAWTGPNLARLTLEFRKDTNDTDVRIAFAQGAGSWSLIGTTCRRAKPGSPTMNFGWLTPDSTDEDVRGVVLHEFGHALGLIHEHQNPAGGIKWNKDAVYAELSGPPNRWDKDKIDQNMFQPWAKCETNFTKVDAKSIMMYPIPKRWTEDGFTAGTNTELSDIDKSFIATQYP